MKKYLWVYPKKDINKLWKTWQFFGTKKQYEVWLNNIGSDDPKKAIKLSVKFVKEK